MSGIQWILAGLAFSGLLPLAIVIFKMRRVKKIFRSGISVTATVYRVFTPTRRHIDIVYYAFTDRQGARHTGNLTIKPGSYRVGDTVQVWYLPANPRRNTVKGAWSSPVILIFVLVIALFILFAVYKMNEMVQAGIL